MVPARLLVRGFPRHYATASSSSKPVIGFVGLGAMGYPMTSNLYHKAQGQYAKLVVHDVNRDAVQSFTRAHAGVEAAASAADVAQRCDVVVTMLPSVALVKHVYTEELNPHARRGALLIDSSTIDPATAQFVAQGAKEYGATGIDAPVSGGTGGAKNATLTFMVGGDAAAFDRAKPLLQAMGKNIVHCGANGMGQVAKLCNNMLLGTTMVALSEALNLGVKLGMDPKLLSQIINTSSGRCWSSDTYNPHPGVLPTAPGSNNYDQGFNIMLTQKDMGLAVAAANACKAPVPLSAAADQMYKHVMTVPGLEKKDFSVVYQWLANNFQKYMKQ